MFGSNPVNGSPMGSLEPVHYDAFASSRGVALHESGSVMETSLTNWMVRHKR